ncbi:MAG: hypothetical protein ABIO46_14250 [Chitinophagales bacterium]
MRKDELIKSTSEKMNQLDENHLSQVADFTEFLLRKQDEVSLQEGIHQLMQTSGTYDFLLEDEVTYSVEDCKVLYR